MLNCQVPVELESSAGTFAIWGTHETILRRLHGHLEGDTIVGEKHKSAVVTSVERLSKAVITLKTKGRKASDTEASISQWLSQFLAISLSR